MSSQWRLCLFGQELRVQGPKSGNQGKRRKSEYRHWFLHHTRESHLLGHTGKNDCGCNNLSFVDYSSFLLHVYYPKIHFKALLILKMINASHCQPMLSPSILDHLINNDRKLPPEYNLPHTYVEMQVCGWPVEGDMSSFFTYMISFIWFVCTHTLSICCCCFSNSLFRLLPSCSLCVMLW